MGFELLSNEDIELRLASDWTAFTYVGCMKKPMFWQYKRKRLYKDLVEILKNKLRKELNRRWNENGI